METPVIVAIIAGGFGIITTFGNILITHWINLRKQRKDFRDDQRDEIAGNVRKLMKDFGEIKEDIDKLRSEVKEDKVIASRARILRFGDECLHDKKHTEEHFKQILADIDAYEDYCDNHPNFKNNVTKMTSERIKAIYNECLEKNDFL